MMINKQRSNTIQMWKYLTILPLVALFLMSFNMEEVVLYPINKSESSNADVTLAVITKSNTDAQLEQTKQRIEATGATLSISNITRNAQDEILSISIQLTKGGQNVNYNANNSEGIQDILIKVDNESDVISVGAEKSAAAVEDPDVNAFTFNTKRSKVSVATSSKKTSSKSISLDNHMDKVLIIVDGKEIYPSTMNDIDPDTIKSINVLKGEKALKEYGEKGKNGVIVIQTKK